MTNNNVSDMSQCLVSKIYTDYFKEVVLYFCSYTHDEMRAEDMTQDLFMKLLNYDAVIIEETAKSLILTMARRMILDDARHLAFLRKSTDKLQSTAEQNRYWVESESLECRQIYDMERRIVEGLPNKMQQVYAKTRYEGLSSAEIAEQMNISKRTVEYHLLMSRKIVRGQIRNAI